MSVDKFDPVYGITGAVDTDADYAGYASNGIPNDKPVREKAFNKVTQLAQLKANDIIEHGPTNATDGVDQEILGFRRSDQSWMLPNTDRSMVAYDPYPNADILAGGTIDLAPCKIGGKRKILAIGRSTGIKVTDLCIFDVETMTHEADFAAVGAIFGLSSYALDSVCCDSSAAYVTIRDATSGNWIVGAINLETGAIKSGWPSGGVTIASYGGSSQFKNLINADEDYLAVLDHDVTIESGASSVIYIVSKTNGTILGSGAGDTSLTSGEAKAFCSNGDHIFFAADTGSGDTEIASMTILNPGANGIGGSYWPIDTGEAYNRWGGMACEGDRIVVTSQDFFTTATVFQVLDINHGKVAYFQSGDAERVMQLGTVCSDGKDFWALGVYKIAGASSGDHYRSAVFRLDGAHWNTGDATYIAAISDAENHVKGYSTVKNGDYVGASFFNPYILTDPHCILSFGGDLWIAPRVDGEEVDSFSRKIMRFRKSNLR